MKVTESCKQWKEEISRKVVATSTFDALHRLNWPHLWRNDTWTVSSYVTAPLTTSRKVLMGQASKGLPRNWTGGRLGCIGGNYIRKWPPQKWACHAGKRREIKERTRAHCKKIILDKYMNNLSSDFPEEGFYVEFMFLTLLVWAQ